jgi:ABC-2 type transport system permease protein
MKQFWVLVQKEFFHVFRDAKTLLLLFGMPVAQIVLFGFALTNEVKEAKILVYDEARDEASRQLVGQLTAAGLFEVVGTAPSKAAVDAAFRKGKIKMALFIPADFGSALWRGESVQLQCMADATDPNTANTLVSYVQAIVRDFQQDHFREHGASKSALVGARVRMLYNPSLSGAANFVPGVLSLILLLVCVLMTSNSIVREKEQGSMEVLLVSPVHPLRVILAKATPYFVLSLLNLTVILILSVSLLDLPIRGSLFLLYAASSLFILTCLALGLLISNFTASQQLAMLISLMGMMVPALLFTGFLFPIENMPMPLQIISNVVPSRWYFQITKAVLIKGQGLDAIWPQMLVLASMATVLLAVSIRKFKIRIS